MSVTEAIDVEHAPSKISGTLAVAAGLVAVIASGLVSTLALAFGVLGLVGLVAGIFGLNHRGAVVIGSGLLFVGVLISGFSGNTPELLLTSMIGTILAMDLGQNAVSVGRQMSTDTFTRRGEFTHAIASAAVGTLIAAIAYGVYFVSASGQPVGAVIFLVLAALMLAWAVRS